MGIVDPGVGWRPELRDVPVWLYSLGFGFEV